MKTYLFTGFPGFLCNELVKELLSTRTDIGEMIFLVLPSMKDKALHDLEKYKKFYPNINYSVVVGDITNSYQQWGDLKNKKDIQFVFHLAAIYDLAVKEKIAYSVNVNGTKNILEWLKTLPSLERFVYFSTAYVAGEREGIIYEHELNKEQTFKNHYEKTKYLAEVAVKDSMSEIPQTIIRPGIVIGHSETGKTAKFDGPYMILNCFHSLRYLPFIPYLGKGDAELNVVPVDYVIKATAHLAHAESGLNKTFHLTHPQPILIKEAYELLLYQTLKKRPKGTLPLSMAKACLSIPLLRKWLRVEKESLDYFTCKTSFDCSETQKALSDTNIKCRTFKTTVTTMVDYYIENEHDKSKHIVIN
ncbi:SDR family oxidoreductase [Bacillus alkalisoli]|uniref:SDR family oxidoreductase n=1 Tax=Bacillus alkalisoli TaxID=2011008 RepID=UPI000C244443|nr:SDR family oxidoreductase [Bacillus alkalisoli]